MSTPPPLTPDHELAALRADFPDWSIAHTHPPGEDRWSATRGPLASERLDERATFHTATPNELRARLRRTTKPEPMG